MTDICQHCGKNEWDGECIWCEPNGMDDDVMDMIEDDSLTPGGYDLGDFT